jgi:Cu(I)/Ag(I) efflux system membrane protein CusA/SilA
MVGGMITATVLTLVVIPAIYLLWRSWQVKRRPEASVEGALRNDMALVPAE